MAKLFWSGIKSFIEADPLLSSLISLSGKGNTRKAFSQDITPTETGTQSRLASLATDPYRAWDGTSGNDEHTATDGMDWLRGHGGDDILRGMGGGDTITADDYDHIGGNDILDGGPGRDQLEGRGGNDVYWTDGLDDIIEHKDSGYDVVIALASITYGSNGLSGRHVEEFNAASLGNGAQYLDINLIVDASTGDFANVLNGNEGNNRLDGGFGLDTLRGWIGDDTYVVRNDGVVIEEFFGRGYDRVEAHAGYTLTQGAHVEELIAVYNADNVRLAGNEIGNKLIGTRRKDVLDGGGGGDTLVGGAGDDTYIVRDARDVIEEHADAGSDTIIAFRSYVLSDDSHVEILQLQNDAFEAHNLTGNNFTNKLVGDFNNNILDGRGSWDHLWGGDGQDELHGGTGGDWLNGENGDDTLYGGADDDALAGGTGDDHLQGDAGNDTLDGGGGVDTAMFTGAISEYTIIKRADGNLIITDRQSGRDGSDLLNKNITFIKFGSQTLDLQFTPSAVVGTNGRDVLQGALSSDKLYGGYGNDVLTGGIGQDAFVFNAKPGTYRTDRKVNFDAINDFTVQDDTIWLDNAVFKKLGKKMSKSYFEIGSKAGDKNDYIIYNKKTGSLSYDADGSGSKYKAVEFAKLAKNLKMTYADFYIV